MGNSVWKEKALRGLKQLSQCSYDGFHLLHGKPYRSLNIGATGIAYTFWKAACVLEDPHWLHHARFWIDHILDSPEDDREVGVSESEGHIIRLMVKDSLHHGNRGIQLVKILISYSQADDYHLNHFITRFEAPPFEEQEIQDLLQGTPGRLIGFAIMYDEMGYQYIKENGHKTAEDLLNTADFSSSKPLWANNRYLGMAHGRGGILYSLLFWSRVSGYKLPGRIVNELKRHAEFGIEQKYGLRWPIKDNNRESFMDSWCHGTPGQLHLWSLAYQLYEDAFFLQTARRAGEFLIHRSEYQRGHVCCGAGGVSYALLALNKIDPGGPWLKHAVRYAEMAERTKLIPGFRLGLYTGLAGIVCLMLDMMNPAEARQPAFQG